MINISFYILLVFIFWKSTLNMLYSKISAHAQITFCLFSQYLILIQKDTKYRAHNMLIICLFFLVNPSRNTLLRNTLLNMLIKCYAYRNALVKWLYTFPLKIIVPLFLGLSFCFFNFLAALIKIMAYIKFVFF